MLSEFTLTPEWKPAANLVVRADLRLDHSTHAVFDAESSLFEEKWLNSQFTALLNAAVSF